MLLVASAYPNHEQPLWNLPGGRQGQGELLTSALRREFSEETRLDISVGELLYVSESYDGDTHFMNATFSVTSDGKAHLPEQDAHIVAVEWVPIVDLAQRLTVRVVREPLLAYLNGDARRYFGYAEAGISIVFAD
ncbi:MAG: NUDIX domain-containing protein [Candidatus Eremiobacteraeota bacterium]|nr:NUDIX domain-containing protein [Candidatus Eremiobacteraeota bacterium]